MTFKLEQSVKVKKLRQFGRIVEILRPGSYRVAVGTLTIVCRESDLEAGNPPPSKHADMAPRSSTTVTAPARSAKQLERLDLHGKTAADAVALLEDHLNMVVLAGMNRFDVLHGIGTGRVMDAVHAYLRSSPLVGNFQLDSFNPGVTRVFL